MPANQATTSSYDSPETHAVLVARDRIHLVADAYEVLDERLGGITTGGIGRRTTPASRPPIDLHVAAVRQEIDAWATWLARAVIDHRDAAGQPWTPAATDAPGVLREIADDHLGAFLGDPLEAVELFEACEDYAARARAAAWPTGARWIRLHVECPEAGTDDAGRRVPCEGEYRMWMRPDQDVLGDMVCDRDRTHRITPVEWIRAMKRSASPADAAQRVVQLRLLHGGAA